MSGIRQVVGTLGVRITAPVVLVVVLLGAGLYYWVLSAISEFADQQIERDLRGISRELFNLCNQGFDDLMLSGKMGQPEELMIRQAMILGAIHEYLRQRDLEGLVINQENRAILLETSLPAPHATILDQVKSSGRVVHLALKASHYYAFPVDFSPWNWRIVPIRSAARYAELTRRVRGLSLFTLGLLLAMAVILVVFFHQAIRRPIMAIVEPIKRGRAPHYRGVSEFEFLSESIAGMMDSLNRSEERYRGIFNHATEGIFQVTPQGSFLNANPSLARICGYASPSELIDQVRDIAHQLAVDPRDWERGTAKLLEDGYLNGYEERFRRKDGTWGMASINVRLVRDSRGQVEFLEGSATDITERTTMEQALRESEAKFRLFSDEASFDGIILYDHQKIIDASRRFAEMFGYQREELMGRSPLEIIAAPEREQAREYLHGSRQEAYETTGLKKDGSGFFIEVHASHLQLHGRQVRAAAVRDVSERKQAEQALLRSEERQRRILDSIAAGILLVDPSNHRIVYANTTGLNMLQARREEVLGRPCRQFICPREAPCPLGDGRRYSDCSELTLRPQRGEPISVMRTVVPIQMEHDDYLLETIVDISDRKALERQLVQAQKMEAIGTLSGGIAHDFNNILQTISGYVQLIKTGGQQGTVVDEALTQIEGAAHRATRLVQRLLTFGRKVEPELRPLDLNREVSQTAKILERTLPKMITVETILDPDLRPIRGDVNQLEQVLLNLGTNAGDAMPEGGRLTFATSNQMLDLDFQRAHPEVLPGPYVLLKVSDTGQGMEPGHLKQIFDPFFTTKPVGKGTGLGLATVYGIVNNHGGHIYCQSALGQGTNFFLYWPALEGAQQILPDAADQEPEDRPAQGETLLVVDDEEPILKVAQEFLQGRGYVVLTANSGERAVEIFKARAGQVQAVIMDLGMPGMGGAKALVEMLAHDPAARVIIASGYVDDAQIQTCLGLGAKEFLKKPYQLRDLSAALAKVLR